MARKAGVPGKKVLIKVDFSQLDLVNAMIDRLTPADLAAVQVTTVNETLEYAYDTTRKGMVDRVNLPPTYIDGKMHRQPASPGGKALASLYADPQLSILTRFPGYRVLQRPINDPSYVQRFGRKGDPRFGIPVGMKQAGVQLQVLRGKTTVFQHGFLMKLKNGNGYGLFARPVDGGKPVHRYGPAVYSLFREQLDRQEETIADHMLDVYSAKIDSRIQELIA